MRARAVRSDSAEKTVRDIRRATRRQYSAEEKIRIVLEGLRGETSIAELCRKEGIAQSMYYGWSKEFLEAGKRRLAGDTAREATSDEVKTLRSEARALKEALAEATLENRLLKKSVIAEGFDRFYTVPTAATARDRLLLALRRDYSEYFCLPLGGGVPLRTPSARLWPQAGPRLASRWSEDQAAPQPNIAVEAG